MKKLNLKLTNLSRTLKKTLQRANKVPAPKLPGVLPSEKRLMKLYKIIEQLLDLRRFYEGHKLAEKYRGKSPKKEKASAQKLQVHHGPSLAELDWLGRHPMGP